MTTSLSFLSTYREKIEKKISESIPALGPKTLLRDACEYALCKGGKRFRPTLVMMVAEALGKKCDVTDAAVAMEIFHTASLIADDLPCMDNDSLRRGSPTLHIAYNETIALLASYALISAGYERVLMNLRNVKENKEQISALVLENVSRNMGIFGAAGGQFLDLFPPYSNERVVREVIEKKTCTLFETSFVCGWLLGGGDPSLVDSVKKMAHHFGMSFQILDDFHDDMQDTSSGRKINYQVIVGKEKARSVFFEELDHFQKCLKELQLDGPELASLALALRSQL